MEQGRLCDLSIYVRPPKESPMYSERLSQRSLLSENGHQEEGKNDSLAEALFQAEHTATILTGKMERVVSVVRTAWLE